MKMTQLIPSTRAFKIGIGTLLVAGLIPVSASMIANPKVTASAGAKKESPSPQPQAVAKEEEAAPPSVVKPVVKPKTRAKGGNLQGEKGGATGGTKARPKDSGKAPKGKLEGEMEKMVARLTPSQKTKLLSVLNSADTQELLGIAGVGKSRCAAIEKARPIESIEGLREIKGLGLKTFEDLVDHGKTLTGSRSQSGSSTKPSTKASSARAKDDA